MEGKRFDHLAKTVAQSSSRRRVLGAVLVGALSSLRLRTTAADDDGPDIASAGNGGVASASGNGGAAGSGNVNSGGNTGNAIGVGDTVGAVGVDGGETINATAIPATTDGGTAIADARGGDQNTATGVDPATGGHDRDRDNDKDNDNDRDNDNDKDKDNDNDRDNDNDKDPDPELCQGGVTTRLTVCCSCRNDAGDGLCFTDESDCPPPFTDDCVNQGFTQVTLCRSAPGADFFCLPCDTDVECGGSVSC